MGSQVGTDGTENTSQGVMGTHQVWDTEHVTRSHGTDEENGGKKLKTVYPFRNTK